MVKKNIKKSIGLGDTVEKITKATGIKKIVEKLEEKFDFDCGCDKRKELLNKIFQYKTECLTEDEYLYLEKEGFGLNTIDSTKQRELLTIYNRVFNLKQPMTQCGSCWRKIIADLQKLYNVYKNQDN